MSSIVTSALLYFKSVATSTGDQVYYDTSLMNEPITSAKNILPFHSKNYDSHSHRVLDEEVVRGWTPSNYPNPVDDPIRCGISPSDTKIGAQLDNDIENQPLFFCDPSSMLEPSVKTEAFEALHDFSLAMNLDSLSNSDQRTDISNTIFQTTVGLGHGNDGSWHNLNVISGSKSSNSSTDFNDNKRDTVSDIECEEIESPSQYLSPSPNIRVAVAVVDKLNLQGMVRMDTYHSYEDKQDLVYNSAQYFARYLYDSWKVSSPKCGQTGILIFVSVEDKVCIISTGSKLSKILPWWRLEGVIGHIEPNLRNKLYGTAIIRAIYDLTDLLSRGRPSFSENLINIFERFGIVTLFVLTTFFFAVCGECRSRWSRWQATENLSKLSTKEQKKAETLQMTFHSTECPICLEKFKVQTHNLPSKKISKGSHQCTIIDDYALPMVGSDGRPIKLLRCGHVFDETCWRGWVNSGQGNPFICPICRRNVADNCMIAKYEQFLHLQNPPILNMQSGNEQEILNNNERDEYGTFEPQNDTQQNIAQSPSESNSEVLQLVDSFDESNASTSNIFSDDPYDIHVV